jgi:predicted nucleic acid-binding protein
MSPPGGRRVVSNTSPLTNLAAIGQLNLLHRLFGHLDIAQAVWDELNANVPAEPEIQPICGLASAQLEKRVKRQEQRSGSAR